MVVAFLLGCSSSHGGGGDDSSATAGNSQSGASGDGDSQSGASGDGDGVFGAEGSGDDETPPTIGKSGTECDQEDARRISANDYCVCEPASAGGPILEWHCYGPSTADPEQVGGINGAPAADCRQSDTVPGEVSCVVTYANCLDGHVYSLSCIEGQCTCMVDGLTSYTHPVRMYEGCPTLLEVNAMCFWDVQHEAPRSF